MRDLILQLSKSSIYSTKPSSAQGHCRYLLIRRPQLYVTLFCYLSLTFHLSAATLSLRKWRRRYNESPQYPDPSMRADCPL
ncbi:hypothetical protein C4Z03_003625 [Klebsiella pneumoniae subsp. pneumoniae]|nr:hypothetical protein C4Z03_003625 [Klebsiella pneumoniae subsp. pneumoniae]